MILKILKIDDIDDTEDWYNIITIKYQKVINLLDNTPNQLTIFKSIRTNFFVEINDDSYKKYKINNQIKFKNLMFKSSLCDYGNA